MDKARKVTERNKLRRDKKQRGVIGHSRSTERFRRLKRIQDKGPLEAAFEDFFTKTINPVNNEPIGTTFEYRVMRDMRK